MGVEENKTVVRRVYEASNTGNVALLDLCCDEKMVTHDAMPGMPPGRAAVAATITWLRTAFPDFHVTSEEMVAEGDKVAVRFSGSGTHKGAFMGIAPTGKKIALHGFEIYRLADGKVVEFRILPDRLSMLQQMGAIPAPAQQR